jgi:hypothetical protein
MVRRDAKEEPIPEPGGSTVACCDCPVGEGPAPVGVGAPGSSYWHRSRAQQVMNRVRQRVRELNPRQRSHDGLRAVIADLDPGLRGRGINCALASSSTELRVLRRPSVHRLRGTIRYLAQPFFHREAP